MSVSPSSTSLTSRLSALAQRLGLGGRSSQQVLERAANLRLPFKALPLPSASIWWQVGPALYRLPELARGALSGPVQEDKAEAHAMLIRLVEQERRQIDSQDLRQIDGLSGADIPLDDHASFEDYLGSLGQRQVRIISYKDFIKAISLPLPRFLAGERICLRQAQWFGERLFWSSEQHAEAFASAITYARRREMEITLPAELIQYRISPDGLQQLELHYHMLAMPVQAWVDPTFMSLLLDTGMPYARLTLQRTPDSPEFLLLPKHNSEAHALGQGLLLAGAANVVSYLHQLCNLPANN